MKNTCEIPLSNGEKIILVAVPEDASKFKVAEPNTSFYVQYDLIFLNNDKWESISDIYNTKDENDNLVEKPTILGLYHPHSKTIDFEVELTWVGEYINEIHPENKHKQYTKMWFNHVAFNHTANSKEESFLSLLHSHAVKRWPHEKNPYGERPQVYNMNAKYMKGREKWNEAQLKVMPSRLLIIKVK